MNVRIADKPYKWFWYASPLILALYSLDLRNAIDFQMHDTYFVIATFHVGLLLAIFFSIFGLFYWLLRKIMLIRWMTVIHVLISIGTAMGFAFYVLLYKNSYFPVNRTYDLFMYLLVVFFFLIFFFINALVSIIRHGTK